MMVTNSADGEARTQRRSSIAGIFLGFSNNGVAPVATKSAVEQPHSELPQEKEEHNTIDKTRTSAFHGLRPAERPLLWRILLGITGLPEERESWEPSLIEKRAQYHRSRKQFHGQCAQSIAINTDTTGRRSSLLKDSADVALMKEIEKDVARTRSDLPFFSDGEISQQWMLRILFVYAKLHPELGYMQGMNEILAPIVYSFGLDDRDDWTNEAEADAFLAFSEIMRLVMPLYTKSSLDPSKTGVDLQMARLAVLLRQHDALLWQHLNSIGLTPDFYSFRWYMTLLAREFSIDVTLRVWDTLLSDPKRFSFLHYVNLALIRSQRVHLLKQGFTGALQLLQRLQDVNIKSVLDQAEQMRDKDRQTDRQRRASMGDITTSM